MSSAQKRHDRKRPSRPRGVLPRFLRGRGGSTAVEFALLALPFVGLLFGIVELGMIYLISTTLDDATADAARQIRTGQLQTAGATASSFTTLVCSDMSWLGANCAANLRVDVRTFASFSSTDIPEPIANGKFQSSSLMFQTGGPGDIILVRTFYPWTLVAPFLDGAIANLGNGQILVESATTFRNEPYS